MNKLACLFAIFGSLALGNALAFAGEHIPGIMDSGTPSDLHAHLSGVCEKHDKKGKLERKLEFFLFSFAESEDAGQGAMRYGGLMVDSKPGADKVIQEITVTYSQGSVIVEHLQDKYLETIKFPEMKKRVQKGTYTYSSVTAGKAEGTWDYNVDVTKTQSYSCKKI